MIQKGRLFVVATPIGNLEDLSFRALRVIREVGAIACEDTRQTLKLLARYKIQKKLISYYQPKEGQRIPQILALLEGGKDIALLSDSGTPGISDPGYPLIREAIKAGIKVIPLPGPSAVIAALSASGLPTHRFLFLGFPPPKKERTRKLLLSLREEEATLVFYLPIRRMAEFLALAEEILGDREAAVARELTKVHEEFIRGPLSRLRQDIGKRLLRGETTVLIQGRQRRKPGQDES
ncbi:MAG TPA: 16S rRNA (cytidine(1402)-2'-O)-methyltransferase [Candidatus Desulfaltia sp.]|nr:16S rRNA (cytidine(1402)-2'-O)-methyltransferase [Candidatus Desulfaltia sp.]